MGLQINVKLAFSTGGEVNYSPDRIRSCLWESIIYVQLSEL